MTRARNTRRLSGRRPLAPPGQQARPPANDSSNSFLPIPSTTLPPRGVGGHMVCYATSIAGQRAAAWLRSESESRAHAHARRAPTYIDIRNHIEVSPVLFFPPRHRYDRVIGGPRVGYIGRNVGEVGARWGLRAETSSRAIDVGHMEHRRFIELGSKLCPALVHVARFLHTVLLPRRRQ